jgi:hypothetical protein
MVSAKLWLYNMAITSHLSVLLLCSILYQETKKISSVVSEKFVDHSDMIMRNLTATL